MVAPSRASPLPCLPPHATPAWLQHSRVTTHSSPVAPGWALAGSVVGGMMMEDGMAAGVWLWQWPQPCMSRPAQVAAVPPHLRHSPGMRLCHPPAA